MSENTVKVSAERKLEVLQRIHLIASMTEEYCNDKKMLAALSRVLKQETKKLANTKYPLTDEDADVLTYQLADLTDIVNRFKKAKKAEQFRMASTALEDLFTRIEQEIMGTAKLLEEKSETRKKVDTVIEKGSEISAKIEKKIGEGVEKLKKSLRDRDSE